MVLVMIVTKMVVVVVMIVTEMVVVVMMKVTDGDGCDDKSDRWWWL